MWRIIPIILLFVFYPESNTQLANFITSNSMCPNVTWSKNKTNFIVPLNFTSIHEKRIGSFARSCNFAPIDQNNSQIVKVKNIYSLGYSRNFDFVEKCAQFYTFGTKFPNEKTMKFFFCTTNVLIQNNNRSKLFSTSVYLLDSKISFSTNYGRSWNIWNSLTLGRQWLIIIIQIYDSENNCLYQQIQQYKMYSCNATDFDFVNLPGEFCGIFKCQSDEKIFSYYQSELKHPTKAPPVVNINYYDKDYGYTPKTTTYTTTTTTRIWIPIGLIVALIAGFLRCLKECVGGSNESDQNDYDENTFHLFIFPNSEGNSERSRHLNQVRNDSPIPSSEESMSSHQPANSHQEVQPQNNDIPNSLNVNSTQSTIDDSQNDTEPPNYESPPTYNEAIIEENVKFLKNN